MSKFRTPKKNRTTYIYRDTDGNKLIELIPGENGITEADIAMLHRYDDDEWNNNYKQHRKGRKGTPEAPVSLEGIDTDDAWIGDSGLDPLGIMVSAETDSEIYTAVHEAIGKLPFKQANAVQAVYFRKITAREYADELHITEAAVSNLLSRAFKNLRNLINL